MGHILIKFCAIIARHWKILIAFTFEDKLGYNFVKGYTITLKNIIVMELGFICCKLNFLGKVVKFKKKIARKWEKIWYPYTYMYFLMHSCKI